MNSSVGRIDAIDIRVSRPGAPLVRMVGDAVRQLQGDDPLRLVRVVAPDSATVDGLRRSLPRLGGSCGAEIGGTLRLASSIAAPQLGDRRPAPPVAVLATAQQVLADTAHRPAMFASCADHPATHDAVVRAFGQLDGVFTLDGDHRALLAGLAGPRASAAAVCTVVGQVRSRLLANGFVDAAHILRTATHFLEQPANVEQPPVVIVVTQQFNPAHVAFLRVLARRSAGAVVVAASTRQGQQSVADHVSQIVDQPIEIASHDDDRADTVVPVVVSCPDHDEEVREVTRRIVGLLDDGVVADRIAVFYPPSGPHRVALASSLAAAGVAARGQVSPALKGAIAGQVLRLLTTMATDGLDRRTLVELARLTPFAYDVTAEGQVRTVFRRADQWNRFALRHGVVAERDWAAFEQLEFDDDSIDQRRHRGLIRYVRVQRRLCDAVRSARSWADLATALEAWFTAQCGTVEWRLDNWKGVPNWQRDAAEQVEGVFSLLGQLDRFGLTRTTRAAARLVSAFLDDDVISAESKGAGVVVDQLVGASGAVFDHAFVLGANDGLLPGRVVDELVLTRALGPEPLGVLTGPSNRPFRDRRGFFAALDGAAHSVTITHARWDVRAGGALYPSPLVPAEGVVLQHVASHAAQVTDQQAAWLDADEWFARHPQRTEPQLNRRRRSITSRRQPRATEFDGQVGPLDELDPLSRITPDGVRMQSGITSFEEFVQCGIKYFVTRVLGARTDDRDPSDIVDIEPRDKGTLVHTVYERLLGEWIQAHPGAERPWIADPDELELVLVRAQQILDDEAEPWLANHRMGHPQMWRARRAQIVSALRRGLQAEWRDGAAPLATEFGFGSRNDRDPVIWQSPSDPDLQIHFVGSIDRLDRLPDGAIRVMDLKTGASTPYKSISEEAPFGAHDDKLQLAFYGWASAQARGQQVQRAAYRFVGRHDQHADVDLQLTPQVQAALHARLDQIATHIRDGNFSPGQVGQYGCEVCSPDGLGTDETNQRLAEWLAAATPEAPDQAPPDSDPATMTLQVPL
jgi:RecB family exonuclease